MNFKIGGPKTRAMLERGIPLWRNGMRFQAEREREIRSQLLKRGVWAIGDNEDNVRMYPAPPI